MSEIILTKVSVSVTIDKTPIENILPSEPCQGLMTVLSSLPVAFYSSSKQQFPEVLKALQDKLGCEMLWAFYYQLGCFDLKTELFNTPYFKSHESSGLNYARQLALSIGVWNRQPIEGFNNPFDWWVRQLIEIALFELEMILAERTKKIKKKPLINKFRRDLDLLEGKQTRQKGLRERQQKRIDAMPPQLVEYKRLLSLSLDFASRRESASDFYNVYWQPFLITARSYVRDLDRGTQGLDNCKKQFVYSMNDGFYCTASRQPRKVEFS